jgi:hypothetical protein
MSGNNTSVIDSIHYVNKASLCSGNNDIDHIGEEILYSLIGQIKTSTDPILHRPSAKEHFPVEVQVTTNIYSSPTT